MTQHQLARVEVIKRGVVAGLAGGGAEIVFVGAMAALVTGISAVDVARGVGVSVGIEALSSAQPVLVGILIHMALAIALGVGVASGYHALAGRFPGAVHVYTIVPAALIGVWAFNFLVLLPFLNPAFVEIVPYPVSFLSKLLFGLTAAEVFRRGDRNDRR
jgi:hypothetical protein